MPEILNVNVLVAAKDEYTKQLIYNLSPLIYDGIRIIFTESQKLNNRRKISYRNFQVLLKKVPGWSSFRLSDEIERIKGICPFLMDLVTAIFVSHVKILACVRLKGDHKRIKVKIPSIESFVHKMYIQTCEKVYYSPTIIDDKKNIMSLISNTIDETIRQQIPIESILNEYLMGVFNDDEDENDENENELGGDDIVSDEESELESDIESDSESGDEQKHIPLVPIERPLHREVTEPPTHEVPEEPEDTKEEPEDTKEEQEEQEEDINEPEEPKEPDEPEKKSKITLFDDI